MAEDQHNRHALGVFPTREEAEKAVQDLKRADFPEQQISVVARDAGRNEELAGVDVEKGKGHQVSKGAKAGAATGGIGGVVLGALEALGITTYAAFLLPGAGQVLAFGTVAANALATAVAGGAVGAAGGGLVGALVGWGVPDEQAKVYHDLVSKGEYLIMVEGTPDQIGLAEAILSPMGIREWKIYEAPRNTASR
ncbi:MAG: general stress protein [Coleofasciculus sp. D1-CHI-01]|uniref:general stress protein n=1 Tax=Coleofasciculus sp. D1-CHI-01 TaxID=3068482 RepID=UPI0033003A4E